jgi:rhodanese-related sulfurtransferase
VLPLAWFYISLVVFLYAVLLYSELRARAKGHVKGCTSLPYISSRRLESLIAIEPDLFIVELSSHADSGEKPQIPDALRMPVSQLESFLQKASRTSVFVFCDSAREPVTWSRIQSLVNKYGIRNVFVLKGGLDLWVSKHQADGMAVAS